jgi:hypothetical protein
MDKKKQAVDIIPSVNKEMFKDPFKEEPKAIPSEETTYKGLEDLRPDEIEKLPPQIQPWVAPIPVDYDPKNDHSYNTFKYLESLGYRDAVWTLAEAHSKPDICDDLQGLSFTTDWLLFTSQHNPPSPIFSRSHPDCRCFVTCTPPSSPEEIPDSAPGLPMHGTPEELLEYKKRIFSNFVTINVDSQTFPPDTTHYSDIFKVQKRYAEEEAIEVEPVIVKNKLRLLLPFGLYRPVIEPYQGVKVKRKGDICTVYFSSFNREVEIPMQFLEVLTLQQASNASPEDGMFVTLANGALGQISRVMGDTTYCYNSTSNQVEEVTNFTILSL